MVILLVLVSLVTARNSDKVEFSTNNLDSTVKSIEFCGENDQVTLVLTSKNSVYRSENNGLSWKLLNPIIQREAQKTTKNIGKVSKLVKSPADKKLVVLIGNTGVNWYSEDCGKTLKALNHGRPMEEFQFHPSVREWGLASSWTKCSDFNQAPCKKYKGVFLTQDLGKSWKLLSDYVVQYSWAWEGLSNSARRFVPLERVYLTRDSKAAGDQSMAGWSYNVDLYKSDDFFASSEIAVPQGNKFLIGDRYILVAQAIGEGSQEVQLLVASDKNFDLFYRAELPVKRIPEHSYTLLDTSESTVFLQVNHYGPNSKYGNIYVSDFSGRRFSVSLLHNVRDATGYCDFDKVYGLEGIYIANYYDRAYSNSDMEDSPKKKGKSKDSPSESYKKSAISFDKGGKWQPIEAPIKDSNNKKIVCEEDCYLHLHSITNKEFSPHYSSENAVGIILGTGNVGKHLKHKADEVNTYISRDAGLTWTEIKKGSYTYEIGDHGAVIVMAKNQEATDTLIFSKDEGQTWESLKFSEVPIEVENIIIEPGATSSKFILYGELEEEGVVVGLDFSGIFERQCEKPGKAGREDSDYELWSPNDGRLGGEGCLMGRKVEYVRRKQDSDCFNGEKFERAIFEKNCECTEEDFECDLGYYQDDSGTCKMIQGYQFEDDKCLKGDAYYESITGYRRVAGDTCVGGVSKKLEPQKFPCESSMFGKSVYMVVGVVLVTGVLAGLSKYSDLIKEKWEELKSKTKYSGYSSDLSQAPEGMEELQEVVFEKPEDTIED